MTELLERRAPPAAPALVEDMLEALGEQVRQAMRPYLSEAPAAPYLDPLVADYPQRGGKLLRGSLCLAAARACGGEAADALPSAAAIELLHNALLVLDDIEDDSELRRGVPTLHVLHGVPLALNAGTALMLHAQRPLWDNAARLGSALSARLAEETCRMARHAVEGQALELGWQRENRTDIAEQDYLRMVQLKTCWQTTIHPLRMGVLAGTRGHADADPLIRLGFFFGAAFQIQDDLLNLEAGPEYGKEIDGDLREGKRTLMVVHALRHADEPARRRLVAFLGRARNERDAAEVRWVHRLLDRTGALDNARAVAQALAGAALREFDGFARGWADTPERRFLRALITWVVQRTH